jgi:hypothetical protein
MEKPIPERPRDAGVAEAEPAELGQQEGAQLLANDAREQLRADGLNDDQIGRWAEAFIATRGSGEVDEFVAWIADEESRT